MMYLVQILLEVKLIISYPDEAAQIVQVGVVAAS